MDIDLISESGDSLFRYEASSPPRAGETITMFKPRRLEFMVVRVDRIIAQRINREFYEQFATVTVREIKQRDTKDG
jgi:hypothetical protein